jgi:hypothetical protein
VSCARSASELKIRTIAGSNRTIVRIMISLSFVQTHNFQFQWKSGQRDDLGCPRNYSDVTSAQLAFSILIWRWPRYALAHSARAGRRPSIRQD